ncbi:iron ABC transporter permease [Actinomycetospora sp. OC33-EN08]|uniref:Iron ABC transporter permease n=1 Tax=Actinomycetospora aurantiaca TaxID=3129233 RepID=A0ABU8MUM3_9PSEU
MRTEQARAAGLLAASAALLVAAVLVSLAAGAVPTPPGAVLDALRGRGDVGTVLTVRDLRVPRTLLAAAVGAALGVGGLLMQTVSRNPLAEPGLLGVTAGAGCALTVGVLLGAAASPAEQLALALVGAVAAAVVVLAVGGTSPLRTLLAGVALGLVLNGVSLGLRLATPPEVFDVYRFWSVGSLAGREQAPTTLPLVAIAVGLVAVVPLVRSLGTLALGDQVAAALGTRVGAVRVAASGLVALLAAAATALAGPIAFVGLLVPLVARWAARGSLALAVAFCLLAGPVVLIVADVLARVALPVGELPVAVVTAFVGGPVLILAVRRLARGEAR